MAIPLTLIRFPDILLKKREAHKQGTVASDFNLYPGPFHFVNERVALQEILFRVWMRLHVIQAGGYWRQHFPVIKRIVSKLFAHQEKVNVRVAMRRAGRLGAEEDGPADGQIDLTTHFNVSPGQLYSSSPVNFLLSFRHCFR